jgi:molecular chaperone DnaK (HSP70)
MDENEDCYCSGCGRCLRQLHVEGGDKSRTLFFPRRESQDIPLVNIGDHELTIEKPWKFIGLDGLTATIGGSNGPRVTFSPKETKMIEIHFNGDALPRHCSGSLRVTTGGINPPLDIGLVCSPMPRFYFRINGKMVRDNHVEVVSSEPENPDMDFEIDLQGAPLARWTGFSLYPDVDPSQCLPLPANLSLPFDITGDKGISFQMKPKLGRFIEERSTLLIAEFFFEQCSPMRIGIEIYKGVVIEHRHNIYHIGDDAIVKGSTTPREIKIEMKNSGGIPAEIISVRSLCPEWLDILNTPENLQLAPGSDYNSRFNTRLNPSKMCPDGSSGDGKIEVSYVAGDSKDIFKKVLNIPIEIREPLPLQHAVAIDFGNTSTCAACFDAHNQLQVVPLDPGFSKKILEFPTIIEFLRFEPDKAPETGTGFRYGILLEKNRYAGVNNYLHRIWAFKSGIGINETRGVTRIDIENKATRTFTFEDLSRFYLQEVFKRFKENFGCHAREVIITFPASFSRRQINKLRAVASDALPDIGVTAEISEPEALALNCFRKNTILEDKDHTFAVFDIGGGTTDISIGKLQTESGYQTVTILVSVGLDRLGGEALTFELARDIYIKACQHFENTDPLFPQNYVDILSISGAESQKLANFMNLMDVAEKLKTNHNGQLVTLLSDGEISIGIRAFHAHRQGGPQFCTVAYKREDFNRVAKAKIGQGVEKLSAIFGHLKDHHIIKATKPDFMILGGNSARLPLVKEMLKTQLSLDENAIFFDPDDAKTAVAKGAAYYGRLRRHPDPRIIFNNEPRLKFPLGIVDWQDRFEVLFPAGSPIGDGNTLQREFKRITQATELAIYWNLDPSVMNGHSGDLRLAAVHSLARYSTKTPEPMNFSLTLIDQGIQLRADRDDIHLDPEIIPIEF